MICADASRSVNSVVVGSSFIFSILLSVANTVKIDKLVVPEVVQSGNSSVALLDCQYRVADENYTLHWLFNYSDVPVYEWSPRHQPKVSGLLYNRIDLTYKTSPLASDERRMLRIVALTPELSGAYTCKILSESGEAMQTKNMLVFSPERDFELQLHRQQNDDVEVRCRARGLYPHPELTLERNGEVVSPQQQRVWRSEAAFDAEASCRLSRAAAGDRAEVTCRLQLPQAGYTAMKKELLYADDGNIRRKKRKNSCSRLLVTNIFVVVTAINLFL